MKVSILKTKNNCSITDDEKYEKWYEMFLCANRRFTMPTIMQYLFCCYYFLEYLFEQLLKLHCMIIAAKKLDMTSAGPSSGYLHLVTQNS